MAEKTYRLVISDRAKQMLAVHIRFLAKVNKQAAIEKKEQIIKEIRSLSYMPQRFPFFSEPYIPQNKYHRLYIENWYLILHQIQDETVYVDYILDCRKDYNWLIHS